MTKQTESLKALIHEMEYVLSCINEEKIPFDGDDFHEALRLGKEALAQPEKERCVGCEACIDTACGRDECPKGWPKAAQPEQEPVAFSKEQMQIYADANYEAGYSTGYMDCAVKTHQNKNPVAYVKASELEELKHCNGMSLWAENAAIHTDDSISKQLLPSGHVPVYTTPPQRKPLTDEESVELMRQVPHLTIGGLLAIEAKLKEKNT